MDLTALNLVNVNTHLSKDTVSEGVAHNFLFKPKGSQGGSMGIIISGNSVRENTAGTEYKVPAAFAGGQKQILFSTSGELKRGATFETITRDDFTLGLWYGGATHKVEAGEFAGTTLYDLASDGKTEGGMLEVITNGVGKRLTIIVRPGGELEGTGETTDDVPALQFTFNGSGMGGTYKVPVEFENQAVTFPWGVAVPLLWEDYQAGLEKLWASLIDYVK